MDRREHYDPEDLEALLIERPFDELLEEERAYVLRHVSGREEYDRMRATLEHFRDADGDRTPLTATAQVREDVLSAFREAKRPAFTIWLNSMKAWLLPQRPFDLWRPALAIAGLALIIVGGLSYLNLMEQRSDAQLAHVEERPKEGSDELEKNAEVPLKDLPTPAKPIPSTTDSQTDKLDMTGSEGKTGIDRSELAESAPDVPRSTADTDPPVKDLNSPEDHVVMEDAEEVQEAFATSTRSRSVSAEAKKESRKDKHRAEAATASEPASAYDMVSAPTASINTAAGHEHLHSLLRNAW